MIHPDIDAEGICIDRVDIQGSPIGKPLEQAAEYWKNKEMTSYYKFEI